MLSPSFLLSALAIALHGSQGHGANGVTGCDTVTAGAGIVSPKYLTDFTVSRRLMLTRGDSAMPFGTQTETLTSARLDGRPALLDIIVFDTPRGKTVDSSWIDPRTLKPVRFQSHNASRSVRLDFEGDRVRGTTTPTDSAPVNTDLRLGVSPFEWNVMALAIAALPLHPGYCASIPVYTDRFGRVDWYRVRVVGDTTIKRKSRGPEPVWEVVARPDSAAPEARYWISRRHRVVSRVLVSEPGVSILYARD
jgi:hypothetical protein